MLLSVGQCCRASVWMASWVAEKVSDSSPILGTMLEKTSIEPHHVGSNRRALRMNGPASQDYGFSHPQLLHLFYLDSFIYQVSAAAPLLRPLGVAQPSSLVLYLGPSAAANNITFACNINRQLYHYIHTWNSCCPHCCCRPISTQEWARIFSQLSWELSDQAT